jgi:peptidoglycan/LPS O-acetylase OafA/YrhL
MYAAIVTPQLKLNSYGQNKRESFLDYRREIDGLRALAVLPVIFFHAGFETFSGGFVGVDIFFVISGYLITNIILSELDQGKFSFINFYERRARRILPALFLVMFVSLLFGFFWLMPDEFENLGQSLVATSLFSNNLLLALTNNYWSLASEFKPLLHTWSLGVEEQYYIIAPFLLLLFTKLGRLGVATLLWFIFLSSFLFANWFVDISPISAFYILPTRAWEIGIGALTAFYLKDHSSFVFRNKFSNSLSFTGLFLILFSIFTFDEHTLSPGGALLLPTLGTVLIIIFSDPNTFVYRILGSRALVFFGLLSYSLYLWHQPFFAYLRVYSLTPPSALEFFYVIPFIFLFSFLTWKYVESPFRNKVAISRSAIFTFSICLSLMFIVVGLFLNKTYGMANRIFSDDISIADMSTKIYNEKRAFAFKKDQFLDKSLNNVLIIGNSFARDFTNITLENFDVSRSEIVYRDDLEQCISPPFSENKYSLYNDADVIVFASGDYKSDCYINDIAFAESRGKKIFYVGTKDFGYNLNWLIRLDKNLRGNQYNSIPSSFVNSDKNMADIIPSENFISLLAPTLCNGKVPITDDYGRMLSTDRTHLTKYGAIYFGQRAVVGTPYGDLFK